MARHLTSNAAPGKHRKTVNFKAYWYFRSSGKYSLNGYDSAFNGEATSVNNRSGPAHETDPNPRFL